MNFDPKKRSRNRLVKSLRIIYEDFLSQACVIKLLFTNTQKGGDGNFPACLLTCQFPTFSQFLGVPALVTTVNVIDQELPIRMLPQCDPHLIDDADRWI